MERRRRKKNTKDTTKNKDRTLANAMLYEFSKYAKEHNQKETIQYSITESNGELKIKIIKDDEHIFQDYLDGLE